MLKIFDPRREPSVDDAAIRKGNHAGIVSVVDADYHETMAGQLFHQKLLWVFCPVQDGLKISTGYDAPAG
jgi:hypothetical protein